MKITDGEVAAVRRLVAAGTVDIDMCGPYGCRNTALQVAILDGHPQIVDALVQGGCNLTARDMVSLFVWQQPVRFLPLFPSPSSQLLFSVLPSPTLRAAPCRYLTYPDLFFRAIPYPAFIRLVKQPSSMPFVFVAPNFAFRNPNFALSTAVR